ncbi:hypothetical protein R1T16_10270 [Flavobacterium sp. DG1-102-2]|uniref:hypothetical protein n=1 Tax=Flavobacterium sp. DG1-102-2 TaxID=3081663 RepID=UPI002949EEC7|nr:hypothetical protein [Flavobacterium sp. DG1-102-2]MDV6168810.1 hypothetical protein [Flavobacterium sp. DG1-102-2]
MSEFLDEFLSLDLPLPFLIFMGIFSLGLAIFHTVIFTALYNVNLRPKWLFFVLNPLILIVSYFIIPGLAALSLLVMAASIFLLAIIGMIRSAIIGDPETKRYNSLKPKKPLWKKIVIGVGVVVFCIIFISSGAYAFIIIFAIAFLGSLMPSSKNRFKKYQGILPTSKIRSLAMGLVEVEGKVATDQPLLARIEKTECIGYKYVIEDISTDKDGKSSYSEIFSETVCNPFYITDETGTIKVNPEKIEFIWIDLDGRYSTGSKRYSQYLLKQNDHMLIIAKASLEENNVPVLVHEDIKNVFGIAPFDKVNDYNTYKPLLNSFVFFSVALALFVALILVSPVIIRGNEVIVNLSTFDFKLDGLFNFLD